MRAWITKKMTARTLFALALVSGLISIGMLCSSRSLAQVTFIPSRAHCMPQVGNFGCDSCNPPLAGQFGCTGPPPNPWSQAPFGCQQGGGPCWQWQNYPCGIGIQCGTGDPIGPPCNQAITLCK